MLVLIHFAIASVFFVITAAINPQFFGENYRGSSKIIQPAYATINIILSSPHAGSDMPEDVPNRTTGGCRPVNSSVCSFDFNDPCSNGVRCFVTTVQDFSTEDPFAEALADELNQTYGVIPFLIVAQWNRKKIDFNREINEATFNHPEAIKSYHSYHDYLEQAITTIEQKFHSRGLLLDVHQHAQGNYTMVGTLLTGAQLNRDELSSTSIELLIQSSCVPNRSDCIRGTRAFGTFLESNGLGIAYPSLNNPKPGNRTFYNGGFITRNYTSRINAIQTELSYVVRNEFDQQIYAKRYARALMDFMRANDLLLTINVTQPQSCGIILFSCRSNVIFSLLLMIFYSFVPHG